jgi:dolichol-phosphate mannosyltransferase
MTYAVEKMGAEVILQMDADLSHDPHAIPNFLRAFDGGADFVVGSRYIKGGSIPENWGLHRKIYSVVANSVVRIGLGHMSIRDWTGGYRAYTKRFYLEIHREMNKYSGYLFQIAFLHKAVHHGAVIQEVPIKFTDRLYGRSKIAPAEYIKNILLYIAKERLHDLFSGSFGKFLVVGGLGFAINTIGLIIFVRLGMHPSVAAGIGAECAIVSNFILNNMWTFRHKRVTGKKAIYKFFQFNGTSLGAVVIQSLAIWIGTSLLGKATYFSFYIVGVAGGLIWNYIMYSRVIWKHQS